LPLHDLASGHNFNPQIPCQSAQSAVKSLKDKQNVIFVNPFQTQFPKDRNQGKSRFHKKKVVWHY